MPKMNLLRGTQVPLPGDPLPESIDTMAQTTVSFRVVPNVETARSILKQAEDELQPASAENPGLFLIGSGVDTVAYVADGSRGSSGRYRLNCINEPSAVEDQPSIGGIHTVSNGSRKKIITSTLPVKPYDRLVQVEGTLWGKVVGRVNVQIEIAGKRGALAQFEIKDDSSIHVSDVGRVPANTAPDIGLYIVGGLASEGQGQITLSVSSGWNYLSAVGHPISMA